MLKLNISASASSQHLATLGPRFDKAMSAWGKSFTGYPARTKALHALLLSQRKSILVGDVSQLRQVIQQVEATAPELMQYLRERPAKDDRLKPMEKLITQLGKVFNYSRFILKDTGWNAYKLVGSYKLRICPYCHLHHVNYHGQSTGTPKQLELRPPLDHFLPKSIYPFLAVSLYNLVPSCHQCNSSIKGDDEPALDVPHPFDSSSVLDMSFDIQASPLALAGLVDEKLAVKISGQGGWDAFACFFHLQERYQWYLPEVQEMLGRKQAMDDGDAVLQSLALRHRYILGFDPKDAEQRALGICLKDIAKQLKVL
ncbi:hypothetical protein J4P02_01160 [Pseudomonas sp. NFXW11]|uniref:hypothetical protein n=1 Tax=Pseudomonas sp. NFXW11 TaxID=2819531 RepID=UPI003CEE9608